MKNLKNTILVTVIIILVSYSSLLFISHKLNIEAEQTIILLGQMSEAYKEKNEIYPTTVDDLSVKRTKILNFINPIEIQMTNEQNIFELYYIQFPLGPKHIYNINTKEWYFDE